MHFHRREDFAEALAGERVDEFVHQAAGPLDGGEVGVHHVLLFGVIALHALTSITCERPRAGHEAWTPRLRLFSRVSRGAACCAPTIFLSLPEASESCHPERRRREGSAFPQMRR